MLVDLESDYATMRRKLVNTYEESHKIGEECIQKLNRIIRAHDRNSSKTFSDTLMTTHPSIVAKPAIFG
jgi:hypothetical protein